MKKLILNVCNGNIHRSVIATLAMQLCLEARGVADQYDVISRGLQGTHGTTVPSGKNLRDYPMEWSHTRPALQASGIMIPENQMTTPVTREIADGASLIFAMDRRVLKEKDNSLQRQFPDLFSKMHLFTEIAGYEGDVPDPFGKDDADLHLQTVRAICSIVEENVGVLLLMFERA